MNAIVTRIYELIAQRGIKKVDLAEEIGVSRNTIQNWKKLDSYPSLAIIAKLCEVFGITMEQFFCGMGNEKADRAEAKFLDAWRMLSETEKSALNGVIAAFGEDKAVKND